MHTITELIDLITTMDGVALARIGASVAILAAALATVLVLARKLHWSKLHDIEAIIVGAVITFTMIVTVEGAWRLAGERLHAKGIWLIAPALFFEGIAAVVAIRATKRAKTGRGIGWYGALLAGLGVAAGSAVSMGATNPAEARWRFMAPVVAAVFLAFEIATKYPRTSTETGTSSWRWTPRRIGIALGLIVAGDQDAEKISAEYQRKRIINAGYRIHGRPQAAGRIARMLRERRTARLQRLALEVDRATEDEAAAAIERACTIVSRLDPATVAGNRQREAEIEAAKAERDHFRSEAETAATRAEELTAAIAALTTEAATIRQHLAEAETAKQAATIAGSDLANRLAEAEKRAETHAATNRQLTTDLHKLEVRLAAAGSGSTGTIRQLVPALALPPGNALPVVEKVAPATVAKVISARTGNPAATQAEIAAASGVSERTVRTVLAAIRQPATGNGLPATNGNGLPSLIDTHE
jgi:uncharacterized membrane-anchored protein YhcB (DUF1043 family)